MKERKYTERLFEERNTRKVSLLIGSRQVGKTTILNMLYNRLKKTNKCLFLDLDVLSNFEKVSSFENLLNTLRLHGYEDGQKDIFYLFLDEFQRYKDMSMIIKNVYDNMKNVKIYASGSSSLSIKDQIQESLAGRKIITKIYPLDFEEFLVFKNKKLVNTKKLSGKGLEKVCMEMLELLNEFLIYGGYPEVVLEKDKRKILESIFDLYVRKDLIEYLKVDKVLSVKKLIEYLAVNNGQKIKFEEACSVCSLNYKQVRGYIEILKETYLVSEIRPFFTSRNKEIVKVPKLYFIDSGVRNFFINNFNSLNLREDKGYLFEGYVISELLKSGKENIKFWQDKNKHEVDIIAGNAAIEVKFKESLKSDDFIGINAFLKEYPDKKAFIVNLGVQMEMDKVKVVLPYSIDFL